MTEPKSRRTMCAVTKIKISHELVTPATDNSEGAVMTALENHRMRIAPLLDALKDLGVDVSEAGPTIESRNVKVDVPPVAQNDEPKD